jgi:hypothetical protein
MINATGPERAWDFFIGEVGADTGSLWFDLEEAGMVN